MGRDSLKQTLDSIARQSWPDIEIVIVNALGHEHPSIPERSGRFPIRFIDNDGPLSRGVAANQALNNAKGEAYLFLDDDDVIMPHHISKLAQALQEAPDHIMMAYTGVKAIDDTGCWIATFQSNVPKGRLFIGNYIPIHAALFRQKVVTEYHCQVDETLTIYEDWDFWLQVAALGDFQYVPGISAQYTINYNTEHPVHTPELMRDTAEKIYEKWKVHWNNQQLGQLREYIHGLENLEASAQADQRYREQLSEQLTIQEFKTAAAEQQAEKLQQQLNQYQQETNEALTAYHQQLAAQEARLAESQAQLTMMQNSRSWRLTAPLRRCIAILRKLRTTSSGSGR